MPYEVNEGKSLRKLIGWFTCLLTFSMTGVIFSSKNVFIRLYRNIQIFNIMTGLVLLKT